MLIHSTTGIVAVLLNRFFQLIILLGIRSRCGTTEHFYLIVKKKSVKVALELLCGLKFNSSKNIFKKQKQTINVIYFCTDFVNFAVHTVNIVNILVI